MGNYLNPDNENFKQALKNEIYVDKTLLISKISKRIGSKDSKLCISRPRRFGKSTDADMLVAYYSKGVDSSSLFDSLKISQSGIYLEHLNKHNVIYLNMQDCFSRTKSVEGMIRFLSRRVIDEIIDEFDLKNLFDDSDLGITIEDLYKKEKEQFIFIIDEWDCIFRSTTKEDYEQYLDFLRTLLKDKPYVELVYMTGILPIKKYGTHSALNMFQEISMLNPFGYSKFMGFTEDEVKELCIKYNMDFKEMQGWYNGYHLDDRVSVYSPRSVVYAIESNKYDNYWTSSETYELLAQYITMNFDGLKETVIKLMAGEKVRVNTKRFQNDMTTFKSKDDVLTLLVHLGYLGYDFDHKQVYIPNHEVESSFVDSIEDSSWKEVTQAVINSYDTLQALWNKDAQKVAQYIEQAHLETSILQYNDENALAYTVYLALIAAKDHYTMIRELPAGKGFADIAFIPYGDKPAMIVELKWDKDADSAIKQIKNKQYPKSLEKYQDNLIIVGINYDKVTKKHTCIIEAK